MAPTGRGRKLTGTRPMIFPYRPQPWLRLEIDNRHRIFAENRTDTMAPPLGELRREGPASRSKFVKPLRNCFLRGRRVGGFVS